MQAAGKKGLFASAICVLLAACHGGSNSTPSTQPPIVQAFVCPVVTNTNQATLPGMAVTCTATAATTVDGSTPVYNWVFGDQTPTGSTQSTTGISVTHVYAQPGYYMVSLNVTDDHGTTASRAQAVYVPIPTGNPPAATANGVENWGWISGAKNANSPGAYQTMLQPSALNQPTSRQNAATWTGVLTSAHPNGVLWMFGGLGYDSTGTAGPLNDLWAFDPATYQWTWVGGSNKANAFGSWPATIGTTAPSNVISSRFATAQWTDAQGNLWLFGGNGYDKNNTSSSLSDMWELDKITGEATWQAGVAVGNSPATAGSQGIPSTSNVPGGRAYATTWVDKNGVFWLFGGLSSTAAYSDLWSYDPNPKSASHPNGQQGWIWVGGSTTASNTAGNYATTDGYPGARVSAQSWVDSSNNLWLFGGNGYDSNGTFGAMNDLWKYVPGTGWTFVSGSKTAGASAIYGTKGTASTANMPGGRTGTIGWVDATTGNFWLFGGSGSDSTSTTSANDGGGALNELWVYNPSTGAWTWMGGTNVTNTPGVYASQYPSAVGTSFNSQGYNTPGSRVWSSGWVDSSNNFWLFGGAGTDSTGTSGYLNDLWTVQLTVQPH